MPKKNLSTIISLTIMQYNSIARVILLTIAVLQVHSIHLNAQESTRVPTELADNIQEVSNSLNSHNLSFKEYHTELSKYRESMDWIANQMKNMHSNTTQYVVAAENYERVFSDALRIQYDYVLSMIQLRKGAIANLNDAIHNHLDRTAINYKYQHQIDELKQTITILEFQLVTLSVLDEYAHFSSITNKYLQNELAILHHYKLPSTQENLSYLEAIGEEEFFNKNKNEAFLQQLEHTRLEIQKLTSKSDALRLRIKAIASLLLEQAEERLSYHDVWITNHQLSELDEILDETGKQILGVDTPSVALYKAAVKPYSPRSSSSEKEVLEKPVNTKNILNKISTQHPKTND